MKLKSFIIQNFKGIGEVSLSCDDFLVLIGENNTGKSSVLQALEWFLSGKAIADPELFRDGRTDKDHAIVLTARFAELTDAEMSNAAVRRKMDGDCWHLRKSYWLEPAKEGDEKLKAAELYEARYGAPVFVGWPEQENKWSNFPEAYRGTISALCEKAGRVGNDTSTIPLRDELRETILRDRPDLWTLGELDWQPNPGGGGNWKSNANSILPEALLVPAVHDAADETQSRGATAYGKLIGLLLERKLSRRREFAQLAAQLKEISELICPDPSTGECRLEEVAELQRGINAMLARVIQARTRIIATPPQIGDLLLPSTTLRIDDGVETAVANQGHGLQRTLILALLQVLAQKEREPIPAGEEPPASESEADRDGLGRPDLQAEVVSSGTPDPGVPAKERCVLLLVEEPEIYMHPQMEKKMRDVLYELAGNDGYQVVCTTHSPVFLDMAEAHRSIVRLEKDGAREVTALQVSEEIFPGDSARDQKKRLKMVTDFDPSVNELFFARRVILVEGDTEVAVFPKAAELFGIFDRDPHLRHDVTLINCHGKWTLPLFQAVLNHFGIRYTVFHDTDSDKDGMEQSNAAISGACNGRAEQFHFDPNLEACLGAEPADKDKAINAVMALEAFAQDLAGLPREFVDNIYRAYTGAKCPDELAPLHPADQNRVRPWRDVTNAAM